MKKIIRNRLLIILSLGILINSLPANAAIINGVATGTVNQSLDSNSFDGTFFFNSVVSNPAYDPSFSNPYIGSTVTVNFRIDTALAPSDGNVYGVDPYKGNYATEVDNPYNPQPHTNWLQMSLTVGGQTIDLNGSSSSYVSLSDGTPDSVLDMMTIRNRDGFYTDYLNQEQSELSLSLWDYDTLNNLIAGDSLNQSFLWVNNGDPSIYDYGHLAIDRGQGIPDLGFTSYDSASLDFSIDTIHYSVVPVPPAIVLFMSGFLGLIGFRKLF